MSTTINYRQNLPVLHSFDGTLHPVGSRHYIERHNANLADTTWEVVEHRDGVAYVLPVEVVDAVKQLGSTVCAPGGFGPSKEDMARLVYDEKGYGPIGMDVARHGMLFSWIIAQ